MKKFLIFLIVAGILVGGTIFGYNYYKNTFLVNNPNTKLELFSTKTTMADVTIEDDYKINLSEIGLDIKVYAKHDIRNLELKIDFCNNSGQVLSSKYKYIGNINKGETKTFTFCIVDIPITKILEIEYERVSVNTGRTFYI